MLSFCTKQPKQKKKRQGFLLNALLLILIIGMFHSKSGFAQTLGINTTGAIPDSSAMLDIVSPNRGLLIPRVSLTSTSDTTTILNPATSLLVYNTNPSITGGSGLGYYYYNGSMWMNFLSGTGNSLTTPLIIGGAGTTSSLTYKPTTGIGTTGADHIFKVGNNGATEAMRILNNGYVGIGTTAPATLLEVNSSSTNSSIKTGGMELQSYALNDGWIAQNTYYNNGYKYRAGGFANVIAMFNGGIYFQTAASGSAGASATLATKMVILNGGNIGIGITSPSAKLHVLSTTEQSRLGYDASNYYSTTVGSTGGVTFDAVGAGSAFTFSDAVNLPTASIGVTQALNDSTTKLATTAFVDRAIGENNGWGLTGNAGTTGANFLGTADNKSLRFRTNNTQKMIIDSIGNVGIGTSTPTVPLTVVANASQLGIGITTNSATVAGVAALNFYTQASRGLGSQIVGTNTSTGGLIFYTNAGNTEAMRMLSSGNVGIGIATPLQKLHIETTTTANAIAATNLSTTGDSYGGVFRATGVGATNNFGMYAQASGGTTTNYNMYSGTLAAGANNYSIYSTALAKSYFGGDLGIGTTSPNILGVGGGAVTLTIAAPAGNIYPHLELVGNRTVGGNQVGTINWVQGTTEVARMYIGNGVSALDESFMSFYTKTTGVAIGERMRIDKAGNVGIGTSAPISKLDIAVNNASDGVNLNIQQLASIANLQRASIGWTSSNNTMLGGIGMRYVSGSNREDMEFHSFYNAGATNSKILMRIQGNGFVGIGQTAPAYQLHVEDSVANSNGVRERIRNRGVSSSAYTVLEFGNDVISAAGGFFLNSSTNTAGYGGANSINLINIQSAPLAFGTNNAVRMTVTSAGNVGIGTTTPNSTLQVNGAFSLPIVTPSVYNYSVTATDYTINVTIINSLITLPSAVGITGRIYFIKANGYTTTILTTSSQTIDGAAPPSIANGTGLMVQSDGSNWIKINQ